MYDVIIIGGGPAGLTAALYASRARLKTLLLEKAFSGGQMATTTQTENYPGFEEPVSGPELALRMESQAKRFGTEILYENVCAVSLNSLIKTVTTKNGVYETKTIILCTGASPRELGLPGERQLRGMGVSYCATCDGALYWDSQVAVIGGGDTAIEDALFLTRFCSKVYLVHRRNQLRATKIIQERAFANPGVEFVWNSIVDELEGETELEGIRIRNLETGESKFLPVRGIFVAIGNLPNSGLVQGKLDMNAAGYILTDEEMQTGVPGVFAAGDIRNKTLRQVVTATADGAVAACMAEKYIEETGL
jgi:thioredoxin reductase (NADPH)